MYYHADGQINTTIENILDNWVTNFRTAAKKDKNNFLRRHMERLRLPNLPSLLKKGTFESVLTLAHIIITDPRPSQGNTELLSNFLAFQEYGLHGIGNAYIWTFDLHSSAFGMVVCTGVLNYSNLVDLYCVPSNCEQETGFHRILICRSDHKPLTKREFEKLKSSVNCDFFDYDFRKCDLSIKFNQKSIPGALEVIIKEK